MKCILKICICLLVYLFLQPHLHANEELCAEYKLVPEAVQFWPHIIPPREDLGIRLELRRNLANTRDSHWIHIKYIRNKKGEYVPYEWTYDYQGILCEKSTETEDLK